MIVGYARVSTADQNLDRQIDSLKTAKVDRIYQEKITGTKTNRPELNLMLEVLRSGDTLVIESFSRLSRSTKDLLEMVEKLKTMGVHIISLKEQLDTSTPTGKMMLTMLSALSQFERDLIAERTSEGLKAARARGRKGGRPKADRKNIEQALKLYDSRTMTIPEITKATGISAGTLYRRIKERK